MSSYSLFIGVMLAVNSLALLPVSKAPCCPVLTATFYRSRIFHCFRKFISFREKDYEARLVDEEDVVSGEVVDPEASLAAVKNTQSVVSVCWK